jgi:hypothetical protein
MTTINRLGGTTQQHRPMTPYEKGQMITHYPTVGPIEMAERLHRTIESVKWHWRTMRSADKAEN